MTITIAREPHVVVGVEPAHEHAEGTRRREPGHNGEDRADRQEAPARMVDVGAEIKPDKSRARSESGSSSSGGNGLYKGRERRDSNPRPPA